MARRKPPGGFSPPLNDTKEYLWGESPSDTNWRERSRRRSAMASIFLQFPGGDYALATDSIFLPSGVVESHPLSSSPLPLSL